MRNRSKHQSEHFKLCFLCICRYVHMYKCIAPCACSAEQHMVCFVDRSGGKTSVVHMHG
jgi:hypothetical protein